MLGLCSVHVEHVHCTCVKNDYISTFKADIHAQILHLRFSVSCSAVGYQVTGVVGVLREHLCLVLPLPLEQKPAVEWLAALEQAVRFSLASRFTDCLSRLPRPFTGQPLAAEGAVLEWLGGHVQQNILLALDVHWSTRLLQACSDRTRTSLQTLWSVHYS